MTAASRLRHQRHLSSIATKSRPLEVIRNDKRQQSRPFLKEEQDCGLVVGVEEG
jgi:hypothetical protein